MTGVQQQPSTRMRFANLGGATVVLFPHTFVTWEETKLEGFAWRCLGCDVTGSDRPYYLDTDAPPSDLHKARKSANTHAGECRAMPQPTTRQE